MNWTIFTSISIILILIIDLSNSEKLCDSVDIQEIAEWANNLPALKAQDEERSSVLSKFLKDFKPSIENIQYDTNIRKTFYEYLSQPLQTVCSIPKKLGGTWLNNCGWFDGEKHVCMDLLKSAINKGECLIYSFGLGSDWSFENTLAKMGCTIRALDPTVVQKPPDVHENIHFRPFGLSHKSGKSEVMDNEKSNRKSIVKVLTLEDTIKAFKDEGKTINYLKVDVEGHELKALPTWLHSGILEKIQQINLELHTGKIMLKKHQIGPTLYPILKALKKMDEKYGFKLIDYKPNGCVGKWQDEIESKYYTFFDIVLMKK